MPLTFDNQLEYTFSFFFRGARNPKASVKELPDLISRQLPTGKGLGLKLGGPELEQGFLVEGNSSPVPMRTQVWRAGGTIWKLQLSLLRMDLVFDAKGFRDISEKETPIRVVRERVATNLAEGLVSLGHPVDRLALSFFGQSSCNNMAKPSDIVAETFFSDEIRDQVHQKVVLDLAGRVNHADVWKLPVEQNDNQDVRINQNESGAALWKISSDKQEMVSLDWRYDVNTSPSQHSPFKLNGAIPLFLERADAWISKRLDRLNDIAG